MKIVASILLLIVAVAVIAFAFVGVLTIFSNSPEGEGWEMRDAFDGIFTLERSVRERNRPAYIKTAALFKTLTDTLLDIERIVQETQETPSDTPEDER